MQTEYMATLDTHFWKQCIIVSLRSVSTENTFVCQQLKSSQSPKHKRLRIPELRGCWSRSCYCWRLQQKKKILHKQQPSLTVDVNHRKKHIYPHLAALHRLPVGDGGIFIATKVFSCCSVWKSVMLLLLSLSKRMKQTTSRSLHKV